MIVKKHITQDHRLILAMCDKELIGKKFSEGKKYLDLTTGFYKGKEMNINEIKDLMKKAYMLNLVGKKSIQVATDLGLIAENIMTVKTIPYTQVLVAHDD